MSDDQVRAIIKVIEHREDIPKSALKICKILIRILKEIGKEK